MKKNIACFISSYLFLIANNLIGQVEFNLFSYSEFFHAPNESYGQEKSFDWGVNKLNFSFNIGGSFNYSLNDKLNIKMEFQKNQRTFDCDCIGWVISQASYYAIVPPPCSYKLRTNYNQLQLPLSIRYELFANQKKIKHWIGVGNKFFYGSSTTRTIYSNLVSKTYEGKPYFFWGFAPELYYQLDYNFYKKVSANAIIGVRKESFIQPNYAIFGKVGLGYQFGDTHTTKRYKKR